MNPRRISTLIFTVALGAGAWSLANSEPQKAPAKPAAALEKSPATGESLKPVVKSEEEWKKQLTPEQFRILRNEGTERAFTGQYAKSHGDGIYRCAGCGLSLFDSRTKFESGTGWPSYTSPIHASHIREVSDRSFGWNRVEVECARCGGHLGHVFNDGPAPTGLRYCINSASLSFEARAGK